MKRVFTLALLILGGQEAMAREPVLAGDGKVDRTQYSFHLSDDDIAKIAPWRLEVKNSSTSPNDAIAIARRQLAQLVSRRVRWEQQGVSLKEIGRDRWIYVVRFWREYPLTTAVYGGDYFEIPVSLRGAIYNPKIKRF